MNIFVILYFGDFEVMKVPEIDDPEQDPGKKLFLQMSVLIKLLSDSIRYGLSTSLSGLLLYNLGKILGEHLYKTYLENIVDSFEKANEYFITRLKTLKIVKDVMIFRAFNQDGYIELICKFSGDPYDISEENQELKIPLAYFFYRGILLRYYELFFGESLKVRSARFSLEEDLTCEFIIEIPLEERGVEP